MASIEEYAHVSQGTVICCPVSAGFASWENGSWACRGECYGLAQRQRMRTQSALNYTESFNLAEALVRRIKQSIQEGSFTKLMESPNITDPTYRKMFVDTVRAGLYKNDAGGLEEQEAGVSVGELYDYRDPKNPVWSVAVLKDPEELPKEVGN